MTRTFLFATGLFVAALAVGVGAQRDGGAGAAAGAPTGRGGAPAGNAANGRKHFVSYGCYQCHGYEGQFTLVVPDRELVVVHLGKWPEAVRAPLRPLLRRIVDAASA